MQTTHAYVPKMSDVKEVSKGVTALDPDLPMLAARAALQLDRIIGAMRQPESPQKYRTDAIEELSKIVSNVSSAMAARGGTRALVDPLTASLFSQAYSDASNDQLESWKDLEQASKKLSLMFQQASTGHHDLADGLELLRDFCVKLSEYAASKIQIAYGERPVPAHWR